MKRTVLSALILGLGSPALAQDAATNLLRMQEQDNAQRSRNAAVNNYVVGQQDAQMQARIADLIASGKCDEAKRVATFYGDKRMIRRTDLACTKQN